MIFTYHVAVFKRRCVTQWPSPSARVKAGSGTGVVSTGRRHTVDQLLARDLPNVHGALCIINPTNAKVWFPSLSPGHRMLTCGDIVIKHVDFYGNVHTHGVIVHRWPQRAAQFLWHVVLRYRK